MAAYLTPGWWGIGTFTVWHFKKVGLGQLAGVDALEKKVPKPEFFDLGATRPFN